MRYNNIVFLISVQSHELQLPKRAEKLKAPANILSYCMRGLGRMIMIDSWRGAKSSISVVKVEMVALHEAACSGAKRACSRPALFLGG
jgi:hypothetical protein